MMRSSALSRSANDSVPLEYILIFAPGAMPDRPLRVEGSSPSAGGMATPLTFDHLELDGGIARPFSFQNAFRSRRKRPENVSIRIAMVWPLPVTKAVEL